MTTIEPIDVSAIRKDRRRISENSGTAPYKLPTSAAELLAPPVMTDHQDSNRVLVNNAKQYRIRKTMQEATAETVMQHGKLKRVGRDSLDRGIHLGSEIFAKPCSLAIVISDSSSGTSEPVPRGARYDPHAMDARSAVQPIAIYGQAARRSRRAFGS
ncbi:MAG TPA: hypothetical protein VFI62_08235 [Burkholderiales bacterium]|nr:hypothetical protein [Burkholderiales bacterium]